MNRQQQSELHQRQRKTFKKKELIHIPGDKAKFEEMLPGVSKSILWGNHDVGPYGAFTRFAPGFDAGMHVHTNDVWIVVLKGAYLYRDAMGEKRLGPGDFLLEPGGMKHWSGGDPHEGVVFYEESSGKFDFVPVM